MDVLIIAIASAIFAAVAAGAATWQSILLRRQLTSATVVARASFYQSVTRLFVEIDGVFLENPSWRPHFYENATLPTDPEFRARMLILAEYVVDMSETCTAAEDALPELTGDWDDFFNFLYKNSPSMREYWEKFGHLYPPRVKRAIVGPSVRPKNWPELPASGSESSPESPPVS
jgi:hypothetical protein